MAARNLSRDRRGEPGFILRDSPNPQIRPQPFDNGIRHFCFLLWKYYCEGPDGIQHRRLFESERSTLMEKKIFHVDVDGNLYRQATEGIEYYGSLTDIFIKSIMHVKLKF